MNSRVIVIVVAFAVILGLPYLLRPAREVAPENALPLVVITPHNEAIRSEFGRGFSEWHERRYGRPVAVDWRVIGGGGEIARYVESEFVAAFRLHWTHVLQEKWNDTVAAAFNDPRADPAAATQPTDPAGRARRAFLNSNVGIGIDVFFGGGWFEHDRMARKGYLADAGLLQTHPAWFTPEVIPQALGGEVYYDPRGRYYGACLTTFGICYNVDSLRRLGIDTPPTQWADLADARYYRQIALADPTKSGSIGKAFEMLIQQQMQQEVARRKAATQTWDSQAERQAVVAGFERAMNLIQRIAGNARYFTDGASQVVSDVSSGNAAGGMCIDFYGRFEAESVAGPDGRSRLVYAAPPGGTSVSADPMAMFRGAPNEQVAKRFIEYVMSPEGQKLWNYRAGTPGGPQRYSLRRLPIRRDLYTPEHRRLMSDPAEEPYELARRMEYRAEWTAPLFGFIRTFVASMAIDPHEELQRAWGAVIRAGGPAAAPEAMAALTRLPLTYAQALEMKLSDPLERIRVTREWTTGFKRQYEQAQETAQAPPARR